MMRVSIFVSVFLISGRLLAGGFEQGPSISAQWNSANHPGIFFSQYETMLSEMVDNGRIAKTFWSSDYWPRFMGGIAFRWQTYETPKDYQLYSAREVRRLSPIDLDELSPAEKFDLLQNDYDFSFTKKVIRQNPANAPGWQGICHGWAEANLHIDLFSGKTLRNKSGIEILFRQTDIAALISYYYAFERRGRVSFLGKRCYRDVSGHTSCEDVNPGALHIALYESMRRQMPLIADVDPDAAVWNHPIKSYRYELKEQRAPSKDSAPGTQSEVRVTNTIEIVTESSPSQFGLEEILDTITLEYWLELDDTGRILGGSWVGESQLDFLWFRKKLKIPSRYFQLISDT